MLEHGIHDPMVLHLVLAASLTELSYKNAQHWVVRNDAHRHSEIGLDMLIQTMNRDEKPDHLLVFISVWFWYLLHLRDMKKDRPASRNMSNWIREYFHKYHLDHVLLSSAYETPGSTQLGNTPATNSRLACLARLTSWLFWADAAACFYGDGGSFADHLVRSSPEAMSTIYYLSKSTLMSYWGQRYPRKQLEDDSENESALELIHMTWVIAQRINVELESGPLNPTKIDEFGKHIQDLLLGKYAIVVGLAKSQADSRDRRLGNADWAVANLYAVCIYLFRSGIGHGADTPTLRPQVDEIARNPAFLIEVMDRSLDGSPIGQIDRFQWPLFWAGVETRDRVHQKWVLERLSSPELTTALKVVQQEQSKTGLRAGIERIRELCWENSGDAGDATGECGPVANNILTTFFQGHSF
ncbi:hypothetical protein ACJ41O_007258 [Fusarium nematophilum]